MTRKLYYEDQYLSSFEGKVISCTGTEDGFKIVLDKTAFFPEGGGQPSDTGYIGDAVISAVIEEGDTIYHIADKALPVGEILPCKIDWDTRFVRMQNHTAEHMVSGLVNSTFGYENVGFHMGEGFCTADFSGELSTEDLEKIERMANEAVWRNAEVTSVFPSPEELPGMEYRSKLELTENVRIILIDGVDKCACCAPHVKNAGEVGVIKILEAARHRGGMRVTMASGKWAYEDYCMHFKNNVAISGLLSAKRADTPRYVERVLKEKEEQMQEILRLKKQLRAIRLESMTYTEGNRCIFEEMDNNDLRHFVNEALKLTGGICAAFSGSDEKGYSYIIASHSVNMQEKAKEINSHLNGRGGGRDEMIQGSVKATQKEIEEYFGV